MRLIAAGLACSLALFACAATQRLTVHQQPWIEARSEHVTLWTDLTERQATRLLRNVERFRKISESVMGFTPPEPRVKTRMFAFSVESGNSLFHRRGRWGVYLPRMRDDLIITSGSSTYILQHELTHFFLDNRSDVVYPKWYHEGFSQYLGATRVRGTEIEIGGAPGRYPTLKYGGTGSGWGTTGAYIPLEDLLELFVGANRSTYGLGQLYPESWALVHYLYIGRPGMNNASRQLNRYFAETEKGTSIPKTVRKAFGVSLEELDRELHQYIEAGKYKVYKLDANKFSTIPPPEIRKLPPEDVAVALGELALYAEEWQERNEYRTARDYFNAALAIDPGNVPARYGLAEALEFLGDEQAAEKEYRAAVEAAPDDPLAQLAIGNFLLRSAEEEKDATRRAKLAKEARSHYVKAWKLDESVPEIFAQYGATYLVDGQDGQKGIKTLEHANQMVPVQVDILIKLARVYQKVDRVDDARRVAIRAYASLHDDDRNETLEELLEQLGGLPEIGVED